MRTFRAIRRLLFFAIGSFYYIFRYLVKAAFVGNDLDRGIRLRKSWFKNILWGLGIQLETYGTPPHKGGLLIANHRSYIDPIIVLSQVLAMPVGKAEVQHWPVIGWGARVSGSIFVDRKTKEGRQKAREDINEMLQKGYSIMNFPEGTTHQEVQTIDFKPGMFRDAAKSGFTIFPIALEYQEDADAWAGKESFATHFFACFGKKNTFIKVSYGPPLVSDNVEELMTQSKNWIDAKLTKLRANWHESSNIQS